MFLAKGHISRHARLDWLVRISSRVYELQVRSTFEARMNDISNRNVSLHQCQDMMMSSLDTCAIS